MTTNLFSNKLAEQADGDISGMLGGMGLFSYFFSTAERSGLKMRWLFLKGGLAGLTF